MIDGAHFYAALFGRRYYGGCEFRAYVSAFVPSPHPVHPLCFPFDLRQFIYILSPFVSLSRAVCFQEEIHNLTAQEARVDQLIAHVKDQIRKLVSLGGEEKMCSRHFPLFFSQAIVKLLSFPCCFSGEGGGQAESINIHSFFGGILSLTFISPL